MKIDITRNREVLWVVCEAMEHDDVIDVIHQNSETDNPKSYDVIFTVNGVELDFQRIINRLMNCYQKEVEAKAQQLLIDKYEDLISEIDDIKERIEDQKERFKYDWEE